jgi:hypothetical protein
MAIPSSLSHNVTALLAIGKIAAEVRQLIHRISQVLAELPLLLGELPAANENDSTTTISRHCVVSGKGLLRRLLYLVWWLWLRRL